MADVRALSAIHLLALALGAGCSQATATPEPSGAAVAQVASGLTAPSGWQALPELAAAARGALGEDVPAEGAEAWGEPARGCYAVWLAVRAPVAARQVLAGLADTSLEVSEVAEVPGALALAFARAPYRGRLRAQLGPARTTALACFANEREPAACEAACTAFLADAERR